MPLATGSRILDGSCKCRNSPKRSRHHHQSKQVPLHQGVGKVVRGRALGGGLKVDKQRGGTRVGATGEE